MRILLIILFIFLWEDLKYYPKWDEYKTTTSGATFTPLDSYTLGRYDIDEGITTVNDSVSVWADSYGSMPNMVASSPNRPKKESTYISFDTDNDVLDCGEYVNIGKTYTISMKFRAINEWGQYFWGGNLATNYFRVLAVNNITVRFGGGTAKSVAPNTNWAYNTWYVVTLVRSGTAVTWYVDGVLQNNSITLDEDLDMLFRAFSRTGTSVRFDMTSCQVCTTARDADWAYDYYNEGWGD